MFEPPFGHDGELECGVGGVTYGKHAGTNNLALVSFSALRSNADVDQKRNFFSRCGAISGRISACNCTTPASVCYGVVANVSINEIHAGLNGEPREAPGWIQLGERSTQGLFLIYRSAADLDLGG